MNFCLRIECSISFQLIFPIAVFPHTCIPSTMVAKLTVLPPHLVFFIDLEVKKKSPYLEEGGSQGSSTIIHLSMMSW